MSGRQRGTLACYATAHCDRRRQAVRCSDDETCAILLDDEASASTHAQYGSGVSGRFVHHTSSQRGAVGCDRISPRWVAGMEPNREDRGPSRTESDEYQAVSRCIGGNATYWRPSVLRSIWYRSGGRTIW